MRQIRVGVFVVVAALMLSGCAAVLVGGLLWKSSKSKTQKQEFLQDLRRINLEREVAGLKPLNECVEMYHFDPGWAQEKAHCRRVIDSLMAIGVEADSTKSQVGGRSK